MKIADFVISDAIQRARPKIPSEKCFAVWHTTADSMNFVKYSTDVT